MVKRSWVQRTQKKYREKYNSSSAAFIVINKHSLGTKMPRHTIPGVALDALAIEKHIIFSKSEISAAASLAEISNIFLAKSSSRTRVRCDAKKCLISCKKATLKCSG